MCFITLFCLCVRWPICVYDLIHFLFQVKSNELSQIFIFSFFFLLKKRQVMKKTLKRKTGSCMTNVYDNIYPRLIQSTTSPSNFCAVMFTNLFATCVFHDDDDHYDERYQQDHVFSKLLVNIVVGDCTEKKRWF